MNNKIALESLAMDMKRVAIGYNRNSTHMAQRFYEEALKRKQEIDVKSVKPYVRNILDKIGKLKDQPQNHIADNALLYSILLQNYIQTFS